MTESELINKIDLRLKGTALHLKILQAMTDYLKEEPIFLVETLAAVIENTLQRSDLPKDRQLHILDQVTTSLKNIINKPNN